jgi:RNA polymerase sigma factor (sigma-70 family)
VHLEDRFVPGLIAVRVGHSADARLVNQLRLGDAEAGRRFIRELYPGIFRYLLYLCGSQDRAEDLTQETFVQAWRSLQTLENGERLRPWLYRIARREFLQAMRAAPPVVSLEALPTACEPRVADETLAVELRAISSLL